MSLRDNKTRLRHILDNAQKAINCVNILKLFIVMSLTNSRFVTIIEIRKSLTTFLPIYCSQLALLDWKFYLA